MNASGGNTAGWGDALREKLSGIIESLREQPSDIIVNGLLFAGIGVLSGFLCRKYSSHVVAVIMAVLTLAVFQHLELYTIVVNWQRVYELFGFQFAGASSSDIASLLIAAIQENIGLFSSYAVGFLIGYKLG